MVSERHTKLIGNKFGRLLVIEFSHRDKFAKLVWKCLCDCGNVVHVNSGGLRSGNTKSCGCYRRQKISEIKLIPYADALLKVKLQLSNDVTKVTNNNSICYEWKLATDRDGYGIITVPTSLMNIISPKNSRTKRCHRLTYMLFCGEIPEGMCVMHTCDNNLCINPEHLTLGTNVENQYDKINKNRQARGKNIGVSKLTDEQAEEIRKEYIQGCRRSGGVALGRKYNVHSSCIYSIINKRTWRDV